MIIYPVSAGSTQSSRPLGSISASQLPYSICFSRHVQNNFYINPLGLVPVTNRKNPKFGHLFNFNHFFRPELCFTV